jgi:hypothetical protein
MVACQKEKWPDANFSGGSHVTVKRLKEVLGDPVYGFTKPALQSQPPTDRELAPSVLTESLASHVDTAVHSSSNSSNKPAALVGRGNAVGVAAHDSGHATRPAASGNVKVSLCGSALDFSPLDVGQRDVKLMIEDYRGSATPAKSVEHVPLTPVSVSSSPDPPHVWFASARELLAALQATCNNIEGAAKMAFPDLVDVGYRQYFLVKQENEHLRDATPNPSLVAIPGDNRLILFVESVSLFPRGENKL